MNRWMMVIALLFAIGWPLRASDDLPKPASGDADQLQTGAETEQKEATPSNDLYDSTGVVTPATRFAEKDLHQQGLEELIKANNFLIEKQYEAASDTALQAYDDLMSTHLKHRGKERTKLQSERHQAATTYIDAGIAYIQQFSQRSAGSPTAQDEARSRLEDMRDVAREYPELNKKLDQAIAAIPGQKTP